VKKYLLITAALITGSFLLLLVLISLGTFGSVPGVSELKGLQQHQASRIVSSDGEYLGTFNLQNRITVSLDEVSPHMIDALIAIEDVRFYNHNGIDYRALGRVFIRTILLRQSAGGGSTITQQLAKNLYPRSRNRGFFIVTDKVREMIIARRLERVYTKEQILELYLNHVSFGEDTFGIEMASRRFFDKTPINLTLSESATLAGLLQATTIFNPHRNPDRSIVRRNIVLRQMERYEMVSAEIIDATIQEPLNTNYNRASFSTGLAPYFREHLRDELASILRKHPSPDGNQYNPDTDGLTVYTTLDSRIQRAAESAVAVRMKQLQSILQKELDNQPIFGAEDPDVLYAWRQSREYRNLVESGLSSDEINEYLYTTEKTLIFTWDGYVEADLSPYDELRYYMSFMNAGFVAMDPLTGHIAAWVGGIDHRHFQYDQVKARRQAGSAFKPILYAAALENGRQPCDYQRNLLATFTEYDDWTPRNHQDEYGGRYSLQAGLAKSVNTVAVQVAVETGVVNVQNTAGKMGIHTTLPDGPSIALGTAEMSLLDLTTAYTSFLNSGSPVEPVFITRIYNSSGQLIYDHSEKETPENIDGLFIPDDFQFISSDDSTQREATGISPQTATAMVNMLQKAIDNGTGLPLRQQYGITHALAGKTGTTQQFTDGWFIGFTPDLVFGTRVGGWNNRVRFREFPAYASQTALPVTGLFLQNLAASATLPMQPVNFRAEQTDTPFNLSCEDYRDDLLKDRIRDFFSGRSSDDPRDIGEEKEEKGGNIFKRIGRKLGIH
jgi:penicillin-binding protein 1A